MSVTGPLLSTTTRCHARAPRPSREGIVRMEISLPLSSIVRLSLYPFSNIPRVSIAFLHECNVPGQHTPLTNRN